MRLGRCAEDAPDEDWRRRLEELVELTVKGSGQMREAIHSLLFIQVPRGGLVRSLRELARTFEATMGVGTSFRVRGRPTTVGSEGEDVLFRVAHEALMNAQRHSGTPSMSVTLTFDAVDVVLAVRDHGSGFGRSNPFRERAGHFGLDGMRRAVEEAGGTLVVANAHPTGVLIEARVPLSRRRDRTRFGCRSVKAAERTRDP